MLDIVRKIKAIAIEICEHAEIDDDAYDALRDQIELCDELIIYHIDDGR